MSAEAHPAENDSPENVCPECQEPVNAQGFDAVGYWHGDRAIRVIPPGSEAGR